MDFGAIITELLKSPLMVAVVSVLGVKVMDYLSESSKGVRDIQKSEEEKLWEQIKRLEAALDEERKERRKETVELDRQKDILILDNAKLNAELGIVKAQNAQQASEIALLRSERDSLKTQLDELKKKVE